MFSLPVNALAATDIPSLPLSCVVITNNTNQICFITTTSPYGPYDELVMYHRTVQGELFLLGSEQGSVATFGGIGFSEGGRYMWTSWAEEGHPSFSFYKTQDFLAAGMNTHSLMILNVYGFDEFVSFTDEGKVSYTRMQSSTEECEKKACLYHFDLNNKRKGSK